MSEWNYISEFCRLLERTEVPPRFAIWCGIASLLASLERRVWINQGVYAIYPNFYMVLVAASGQKKSTSINTAGRLLRKLNPGPNVVSQKITPEALISSLQKSSDNPKELLKTVCGGIVIADELATFLDRQSLERGLGPILTALYDCTPFEYQTKARGTEKIAEGYLSILGGTTIELLRSSLPKDAIGGGFTSRTMFVYEEAIPPPVAWIDFDEALLEVEARLLDHLQRLGELKGSVELTPDAKKLFISIYNERHAHSPFRSDPFLKQYENRRHAHLLKIAMALMVSDKPRLVMDLQHVRGAQIILEEAEEYLPRVVELIVASENGMMGDIVYNFIAQKPEGIFRTDIQRHFSHKLDARELTLIIETLVKSDRIKMSQQLGKLHYQAIRTRV